MDMFQEAWKQSKHFISGSLFGLMLTGCVTQFQNFTRTAILLGIVDLSIFFVQLYLANRKD